MLCSNGVLGKLQTLGVWRGEIAVEVSKRRPFRGSCYECSRGYWGLQRLEQHVKALATIQSFAGTVAKIQQDRDRYIRKASGFTLGQAIGFWMETLEGSRPVQPFVPDMFAMSMQGRFRFELDGWNKRMGDQIDFLVSMRRGFAKLQSAPPSAP